MATGGIEADNRITCSVCLETYRGRGAKILPCFHTFCVPCLAGLVKRTGGTSQTFDTPGLDGEEGEGGSADRLTCPTCSRVIPVPAGGVTAFQTNFYVDSSGGEEDGQPVPCTLCDGDQTAQFHCDQCQNSFCSLCQRAHNKFCRGSQVRSLQDPPNSSSTAQSPSNCQVRQQLQQVEESLKKLTEEERKLYQDREAMDYSISVRYATLLRHAADARDTCCLSLGEVCDGLTERLHSSMAEARQTRDTLQQQLSSSQPAPVLASKFRAAMFLEGELPMILNRDLGSSSLLQHHMEENASLMVDALQSFMGKVVRSNPSSDPAQNKAPSGSSPSFQDGRGAMSSAEAANPRNLQDLYKKLEDVTGQVTSLQSTNSLLSNAHSKLSTEHRAVQREVMAMRYKHAIVHQDLAVLTAEKDKVSAELGKVQKDVVSMQTDTPSAILQTGIRQLKADQGDVTVDITTLQGDGNKMKKDITALQGDNSKMKTDITALQGDNSKMKKDCDQLKTDVTNTQGKLSHLEFRFCCNGDVLRVVLLGRRGAGKSSLGNSLTGLKPPKTTAWGQQRDEKPPKPKDPTEGFKVARGLKSGILYSVCRKGNPRCDGTIIEVTDTPGLCDPHPNQEEIYAEVAKSVALAKPGPHVIIFTLRCDRRFTEEEYKAYKKIQEMFSEEMNKHLILVFNGMDCYIEEDKETTLEEQRQCLAQEIGKFEGQLNDMIKEAGNRFFGMNNKATGQEKDRQINDLVHMMKEMVKNNGQDCVFKCPMTDQIRRLQRR